MASEVDLVLRLVIASILGAAIGYERERRGKTAGLRTHILVCMGSALITIVGMYGFGNADPARLAAGIITGIGFLGAGAIIASGRQVHGLTTAASIWVVSAIGIAAGAQLYLVAVTTTILSLIVLQLWLIEPEREKRIKE
ncbi:MgtC/SapB family protein [Candidatus Pacearchaeota archaeon]|nr:MgtC/SapB family protein [Candidatus Pacearchaeota archaeon]